MGARLAWLVMLVGCYRVPSDLSCKIACDEGCPSGMTCIDGYCTSGEACDCGALGRACCSQAAACATGGYCSAGTCSSCVAEVSLGRRHACIVEHDGTVWCAGNNDNQQLGKDGSASDTFVQVSDAAGPISDAIAIAAGRTHSCALRGGGHVWCWGGNGQGELGDNTGNNSSHAVEVVTDTGEPLAGIVEIGVDYQFSCGRASDGSVWCWGRNDHGQLGDNTFTIQLHAVHVQANFAPLAGATALSVGGDHTCAIANDQPWCWGQNGDGRNGDGTTFDSGQAVMFGSKNALAIAAGHMHSCAIATDGTIECAGSSWMNRLGDGRAMTSSSTPVTVLVAPNGAPYAGAHAIAAGGVSCILDDTGGVACWGNSPHGQTGNNGGAVFPTPVTLPVAADRVIAHWAHACAHGTDGSWWCWGRDIESELGDGSHANVAVPMLLAASCN